MKTKKHPQSLKPRYVYEAENAKRRIAEILAAMTRYVDDGKIVPGEWIDEFYDLNELLRKSSK